MAFLFTILVWGWIGYQQTYSKRAYAHRQHEVQEACLKANPVSRGAAAEAFAAASACFELPGPPPSAGLVTLSAAFVFGPVLFFTVWLGRLWAIRRQGARGRA